MGGAAWFAMRLPTVHTLALAACRAAQDDAPFQVLTVEQAKEIAAMTEQILPSDETPGAREAGVIHFIDKSLEDFARSLREPLIEGLDELRTAVGERHSGEQSFADLSLEQQTAVLTDIEDGGFFGLVRFLSILGMFAIPAYGGNRDEVGWQVLGFENRGTWQPPFGWYDEQYAANGGDASQVGNDR